MISAKCFRDLTLRDDRKAQLVYNMHFLCKLRRLRKRKTAGSKNGETSVAVQPSSVQKSQASSEVAISPSPSGQTEIASPTPCTIRPLGPVSDASSQSSQSQLSDYLWARAYEILEAREPELMGDFKKHLTLSQDGTDPSTVRSVESIAKGLVKRRDDNQWRVLLLGKRVHIRRQIERLAKFVLWVDNAVKPVLVTQPYAMLAWSGASLFFLVCQLWSTPISLC